MEKQVHKFIGIIGVRENTEKYLSQMNIPEDAFILDMDETLENTVTAVGAPLWATLVCTQAGTTAASEPSGYARITKAGDKVLDGTAVFTARNIIGELDSLISTTGTLEGSMKTLDAKVAEMMSSTGLVMKLISLDEYRELESYNANTIYLCYEDEATKRVTRIFVGEDRVYAAGVKVTYRIDTGHSLERVVADREDAIAAAPDASLEGYSFVGWRQDNLAEKKVLSEYIITTEEPVTLYLPYVPLWEITLGHCQPPYRRGHTYAGRESYLAGQGDRKHPYQ